MKRLMIFLAAVYGYGSVIMGQNAITASGGNAEGSGGSASYSVGQIVYTTNISASDGSVAQGVQQPYEISVITSLEKIESISFEIKIYPNPSSEFLRLKVEGSEVEDLRYQLFNINGNILIDNKLIESESDISMQDFPPAAYILKVIRGDKEMKTFKIIKNR